MSPTIQVTLKDRSYRFLWLKYVRAFDPDVHCAKCLVGRYSSILGYRRQHEPGQLHVGTLDEHPAPYVYLCGVTSRWVENLHVAMVARPGASFVHEDRHCVVVGVGVERLAIPELPEGHGRNRAYSSCRCYRFGFRYLGPGRDLAGEGGPPGVAEIGGTADRPAGFPRQGRLALGDG